MKTLLLDGTEWDLVVDASRNIAVASEPYSLAQDACSAARLFKGELWYNILLGVPYWPEILGHLPPLSLLKAEIVKAALTVPGVKRANAFFYQFKNRKISGQLQVTDAAGQTTVAEF